MKLKITLGIVTFMSVMAVVFYLVNRPNSGAVSYPSPNGYDAVSEAGRKMSPLPSDFDATQDLEAMGSYLDANADSLALLDQAMDWEYRIRLSEMQTMQALLDNSAFIRNASRLLIFKARRDDLEGRSAEAADTLAKIAVLGRRSSRGGLMIHQQIAVAIEKQGLEGLMQVFPRLSADQRTRIADLIGAEDAKEPDLDTRIESIIQRERDMTKREHGTFFGSFMLWQLSDRDQVQNLYNDVRSEIVELQDLRQELIDQLKQTEPLE